ncbi:c6 transcription factor [Trichoderma cornu-damae]|uniref:C6 transcription factor n=1 Tax=Trichoderma cornu-damae TaxID=654480 RepID=A0A9P8QRC5_9HYPO|nr:c6 transcription factor [Trichoderma cornu-damae]
MSNRAAQACDGCRVRKVKCNSTQPCSQCSHLGLGCIYSPSTKRKPSVRNRLVTQLRNKSNIAAAAAASATATVTASHGSASTSLPDIPRRPPGPAVTSIAGIVNPDQDGYPAGVAGAGFGVCIGFFIGMLPKYEEQVYPVSPIITTYEVRLAIDNMHADLDDAAFVYAAGAVTINLAAPAVHGEAGARMTELIRLSLSAYRRADSITDVRDGRLAEMRTTFKRIMTCVFLEVSMMALNRIDRSFAALREAATMVQMMHARQCSRNAVPLDPRDVPKFQRVYWQVFIHERFLAILSGFPCVMAPLPSGLPARDASIPAHIDVGFNRLVRLFQIMDGPFLLYWGAQQNPAQAVPGVSLQWIESKQAQLDQDEAGAQEAERALVNAGRASFTEPQYVDLFVTRLWMRTLLWRFGLTHRLLPPAPPHDVHQGPPMHFPAAHRLSFQLRTLVGQLGSVSTAVTHGIGLLHKIFEIASTVADVLALPLGHGQTQEDARSRIQDFATLVRFLLSFERAEREQRDYLREKLGVLQQQYTIVNLADMAGLNPTAHGAY